MIGIVRRVLDSVLGSVQNRDMTHDVLITVMTEVCAIVNARPIVLVTTDGNEPEILNPASLLTMKIDFSTPGFDYLDIKDIYKSEWKCVQFIAERFWKRWREEFLQQLQPRRKWNTVEKKCERRRRCFSQRF